MNAQRAARDTREHPASGSQNDPQHKARHICCEADRDGSSLQDWDSESHRAGQTKEGWVQYSGPEITGRGREGQLWLFYCLPHGTHHGPLLWFLPLL